MGQSESSQGDPSAAHIGTSFHVLRVAEHSPAAEAGIDPFFDFLCGINGIPLTEEIEDLTRVIEKNEGRTIVLQLWSTKRRETRNVKVIPSRSWALGATTSTSATPSLLGLSLRLCDPKHALEQVWHVLEILEGSPAQSAGLVPLGDWIVGYAGGVLRGEGDFYDIVEAHVDKPLRLFVYNADYDVTREAILVPNRSWGGEGLLGCGVGYGLLHRIPKPQDRQLPEASGSGSGSGGGGREESYFDEDGFLDESVEESRSQYQQQQQQYQYQQQQAQSRYVEEEEEEEEYAVDEREDERRGGGGGRGYEYDSRNQGRNNNNNNNTNNNDDLKSRNRREDSEGYEEAFYEEISFGVSQGVEVIPSRSFGGEEGGEEEDHYHSTPPPPPSSSSSSTRNSGIAGIPSYRPPPKSPSAFPSASRFGVEQIQEEEE